MTRCWLLPDCYPPGKIPSESKISALRHALKRIADHRLCGEITPDDRLYIDFVEAHDMMIEIARNALEDAAA